MSPFVLNCSKGDPSTRTGADSPFPFLSTAIMSIFGTTDQDEHDEEVANAAAAKGTFLQLRFVLHSND